jgi:hypothetical protein
LPCKLDTRAGFLSPSLDGGLPLFELFNPRQRSSSEIRAFRAAFSALTLQSADPWMDRSAIRESSDS